MNMALTSGAGDRPARGGPWGRGWVLYAREMNMADQPFVGFSDMMTQNFEQTDAADLKRKIKDYLEKNIAAANEFIRKLSEAKDS